MQIYFTLSVHPLVLRKSENSGLDHWTGLLDWTVYTLISRAPPMPPDQNDEQLEDEIQAYVDVIIQCLLATEQRLAEIQCAQENDPLCQEVARYCREGLPEKRRIKGSIKRYYSLSSEISIVDGLLLRNE